MMFKKKSSWPFNHWKWREEVRDGGREGGSERLETSLLLFPALFARCLSQEQSIHFRQMIHQIKFAVPLLLSNRSIYLHVLTTRVNVLIIRILCKLFYYFIAYLCILLQSYGTQTFLHCCSTQQIKFEK